MSAVLISLSFLVTNVTLETFLLGKTQAQVEAILGKPSLPNGGLIAAGYWITYDCSITVFYSHDKAVNLDFIWHNWQIITFFDEQSRPAIRVEKRPSAENLRKLLEHK